MIQITNNGSTSSFFNVVVYTVFGVVVVVMRAGDRGEIGASFAMASETSPQNPLIVNLSGALPSPTLFR